MSLESAQQVPDFMLFFVKKAHILPELDHMYRQDLLAKRILITIPDLG